MRRIYIQQTFNRKNATVILALSFQLFLELFCYSEANGHFLFIPAN